MTGTGARTGVPADGPRILIVGAGIAGLALAASLERFGITPVIAEIEDESLSRGLALMLTSNAALAMGRIGLGDLLSDRGVVLESIIHTDPAGASIGYHDLGPSNERYGPNIGITRADLMAGLSSATRARIRYGTTIASVGGSAAEPEVELSDGTRGSFDLVVGADGIRSAVRQRMYPDVGPQYRSFCAWRTVMESPGCAPVFRLSSTDGYTLGSFPVAPNLMYAFLLVHFAEVPALTRHERLARLKELTAQFKGNVSPLIQQQQAAARVIFVPVLEVRVPSYYQGRLVLIGDAAHAFSPLLAQGAAMAIEDAVALAESLGRIADVNQALRWYESRRQPRVEIIRAAVRRRTVARGLEGPVTAELLNQHPPVFSASLKVYDEMIEDPFALARDPS